MFPLVEYQARLVAAYRAGFCGLPPTEELETMITADERPFTAHRVDSPRHTRQGDYFVYEHELRTKEPPCGRYRAARPGAPVLVGRV
ncbi:hypothetical protein [Spirillospora sp. NBC_01491]|uniref:hypothetical protein n=1 Tax=Spirillospora sp. NBC_01491 TaxID=2976007 RepID=UPI002E30C8C3|nr:hypothetical protein [Spirillospora sp. NBC_01491]